MINSWLQVLVSTANELVAIAGGKDVMASSVANWQAISSEAALVLTHGTITMSIGGHEQPSSSELLNAFKFSNAVKNKRVHNFDVAYLLSMGPRTP